MTETVFTDLVTTPMCTKCNDTGYLSRRFYTSARQCTCQIGQERLSWDTLTPDERNARCEAEATANRYAVAEARKARRAKVCRGCPAVLRSSDPDFCERCDLAIKRPVHRR